VFWVRSTVEATMKKTSRGRIGDKDEDEDVGEQGASGSNEKKAKSSKCLFHSLAKARAGACKDTCSARVALGLVHEMRPEDRAKYERVYHEFGTTGVLDSVVGTDFVAHLDSLVAQVAVNEVNRKAPDQLRAVDSGNVVIIDRRASGSHRGKPFTMRTRMREELQCVFVVCRLVGRLTEVVRWIGPFRSIGIGTNKNSSDIKKRICQT
jgi:hypothetical protein